MHDGGDCPCCDRGEVDGKDYALFAGNWSGELIATVVDEDFETGDFSKYDWQHSGDANTAYLEDDDGIVDGLDLEVRCENWLSGI